jgi:hypothetical protein
VAEAAGEALVAAERLGAGEAVEADGDWLFVGAGELAGFAF